MHPNELARTLFGKFKIGDLCLIKPRPNMQGSEDARLYEGKSSKIVTLERMGFATLAIEYTTLGRSPSGIWLDELELVGFSEDDYETVS